MSRATLKNTETIQFVAAEEQSVETKAGPWLSRVHFWVRGPNTGLWFWSVAQACGKAIASGYANSRNEAMQACMEFIRICDGEHLSVIS